MTATAQLLDRLASSWPLLVPRKSVSELLNRCPQSLRALERAGKLPEAVHLGYRSRAYQRDELLAALGTLLGGGAS